MSPGGAGGGGRTMTWHEEIASLVDDTGTQYPAGVEAPAPAAAPAEGEAGDPRGRIFGEGYYGYEDGVAPVEESLKDQVKGFLVATAEMLQELGRGCRDIVQQSLEGAEDTYVVKKLRGPLAVVSSRLSFLNDYLPEDRDPMHAWPVVICVFLLALIALNVNSGNETSVQQPRQLYIGPPNASRIQLPDGRHTAYQEQGVQAERARFSLIAPHSFLSSRLAGLPGLKASLLDEFGVRFIAYDLPGFGESDPHPSRNLNSSALDMLHLANALGVTDKFWVMGYSAGSIHAWAAVRYIPDRLAGVAMFAPMVNPYDSSMTKEEQGKTWEKWTTKRKLMYVLARRFPSLLPHFYRRSFLSGKQGKLEKWLSLSLGKKDKSLLEEPNFNEFWEKDVAESVRQGDSKPFVEEAVLQVSDWGFNLADLQVQKQHRGKGLLQWLKSMYSPAERQWTGFLGPIHIWQGMDDRVMPPSMTEFVRRVVPGATVHRLLGEGHFSYFCFCDECHRHIFSTLFGIPQGPLSSSMEEDRPPPEEICKETALHNCTEQE
ncbi:uncharacterized protein [Elaeis guineensis]|uniref:Uncharacterized protein LOC105044642 isoform X1 n=1 Tax=Elaeis guineensis var. tenera TaxID=51953 RepID=A0A6I9R5V4_ELAGV|nr:uncharacterized protein LOC105044642 isoform X1 [Elaeis guineensis]